MDAQQFFFSNKDLWQLIFSFLCHFDVARCAGINRAARQSVLNFFCTTKRLLVRHHHMVNASKLLQWNLLPVIQHLEIQSLRLKENVTWPCGNLTAFEANFRLSTNFHLHFSNLNDDSRVSIQTDRPMRVNGIPIDEDIGWVKEPHQPPTTVTLGPFYDNNDHSVQQHPLGEHCQQQKRQRIVLRLMDMQCQCLW